MNEKLVHIIASILDHPSVYMGGPSQGNRRKAQRILEVLEDGGYINVQASPSPPQSSSEAQG